jgi:tetratricopeptide (TPR) repeat protein
MTEDSRGESEWAATQNSLGHALQALGERESGTERLEEAVNACRDALQEWTRERMPLQWAMTQNNLGNVLQALGERESGTARLNEAANAYRDALQERTHERVPLEWAMTQNNLGTALATLGERESGTERLEEAVNAFRNALQEWTRERVPLEWAMTQNNLGRAEALLNERFRNDAPNVSCGWKADPRSYRGRGAPPRMAVPRVRPGTSTWPKRFARASTELSLLLSWLRQRRRALDKLAAGEVSSAMGY